MEKTNFENLNEEQNIKIEELDNGDILFVNGLDQDNLLNLAISICKQLDKSYPATELDKQNLLADSQMRPSGCYSVAYDKNKEGLIIDNRNARGDKYINQKMKEAVDSAIKKYYNPEYKNREEIFINIERELKIRVTETSDEFRINGSPEILNSLIKSIHEKLNDVDPEKNKESITFSEKITKINNEFYISSYIESGGEFYAGILNKGDKMKLKEAIYSTIEDYYDKNYQK